MKISGFHNQRASFAVVLAAVAAAAVGQYADDEAAWRGARRVLLSPHDTVRLTSA